MSLIKSTILSLDGYLAIVEMNGKAREKPLEIPKGASAESGDYALLDTCGGEYVISIILRKKGG